MNSRTRPLKVLQVVGAMNRAGAETWLMHMLRTADRTRLQMDFLVHSERPSAYDDEIRSLGGQVIPCLHPGNPLAYAARLRTLLEQQGPYDVVHSHVHHFSGLPLAVARACGVPVRIAHSHLDSSPLQRDAGLARRAYLSAMVRLISASSTLGLACSRVAARDLFGRGWEQDPRWRLLYCGIDLRPFADRGGEHGSRLRAELGLPSDARVVGHVGRFSPQKNHAFLLELAQALCARRPDVRFLLVGEGPLHAGIAQGIRERGLEQQVLLTGARPDVALLMQHVMDAFVLPSHFEGLPLVGLEAQAAGLPSVISEAVTEELKAVDGLATWLPLAAGAEAWSRAVEAALDRERLPPGEGARRMQHTPFALAASLRGLEAAYGLRDSRHPEAG